MGLIYGSYVVVEECVWCNTGKLPTTCIERLPDQGGYQVLQKKELRLQRATHNFDKQRPLRIRGTLPQGSLSHTNRQAMLDEAKLDFFFPDIRCCKVWLLHFTRGPACPTCHR